MMKYDFRVFQVLSGFCIFFLQITTASANIYKCEAITGEVYYHYQPCPVEHKETELRREKDVKNGYIPPKYKEEKNQPTHGIMIGDNNSDTKINTIKKRPKEATDTTKEKSQVNSNGVLVSEGDGVNLSKNDEEKVLSLSEEEELNKKIKENTPKITKEQKMKVFKAITKNTNFNDDLVK